MTTVTRQNGFTAEAVIAAACMGGVRHESGQRFFIGDREVTALVGRLRKDHRLAWMGGDEFTGGEWWIKHTARQNALDALEVE